MRLCTEAHSSPLPSKKALPATTLKDDLTFFDKLPKFNVIDQLVDTYCCDDPLPIITIHMRLLFYFACCYCQVFIV